jgi:DEAD/DEAH box helicase domain-containing protein
LAKLIVFDIETQHLADEMGGWHNLEALRVAVAVTWDEDHGYRTWWEGQAGDLVAELDRHDMVIGYNVNVFDYAVLSLYGRTDHLLDKTFDILDELYQQTGKRVPLNLVAQLNLGEAKAYQSGADAVKLWRDGRLEDLAAYCTKDVELTQRLYQLWEDEGILWTSGLNYAVWPGPKVVKGEVEVEHDVSPFTRPRGDDPGGYG